MKLFRFRFGSLLALGLFFVCSGSQLMAGLTATPVPSATIVVGAVPTFNVSVTAAGTVAASTVTAGNGASQTNHLTYLTLRDSGTGQQWTSSLGGTSGGFTWTDPRGGMAAGTRTYVITAYYTGFTTYDNFYPGHWEDEHDNPDDGDEVTGSHWEPDHHDYGINENDFTQFAQQTTTITAVVVAPTITTQPVAVTKSAGLPATFTVTPAGTAPFTYQWRKDGTNVAGATGQTLTLANVQAADMAAYSVVVSNSAGSVASSGASLTVTAAAPSVLGMPASSVVNNGTSINLTVSAAGTGPLGYQWRKNGADVAGATNATLALTGIGLANTGSYTVIVTNSLGTVTSSAVTLGTYLTATPVPSATIVVGAVPTFTVSVAAAGTVVASTVTAGNGASQTNHLTYLTVRESGTGQQWTSSLSGTSGGFTWTDPRGGMAAGTRTYIITAYYTGFTPYDNFYPGHQEDEHDNPDDGDEVTGSHWEPDHHDYGINENDFTQFDQQTTIITAVVAGPTIATQPVAVTKSAGLPATFSVTPAGTAPFTYQWRKDGTNIAGATGQSLTLANVQAADMAAYSVVVSNSAGSVTSAGASLTVTAAAPSVVSVPVSSVVNNGTNINLTVSAAGTGPLSYQWRKNGVDVAGATGATLSLTGIGLVNTGSYTVVLTNSLGTVTSSAVTLGTYLTATPVPSATIVVGAVPTFNVTVAAEGTVAVSTVTAANGASQTNHLTYLTVRESGTGQQWTSSLSGASASFTWADPRGGMAAGTRTYIITAYYTGFTTYDNFYPGHWEDEHDNPDDGDEVTGSHWEPDHHDYGINENDFTQFDQQATVITAVVAGPTIAMQPVAVTKSAGLPATFTVIPAGTAPFTYQWRKDGTNIAGATGQTLTLANVQSVDAAAYSVVVSNSAGLVTSSSASLTVTAAAPSVVSMPASSVVNNGTGINLTVSAAGTGPLSYQWRKNGVDVVGATNATLALTGIGLANTGSYTVVLTNSLGTVTSSAVTLGTYLTATPVPAATIVVGAVPTFNVTITAAGTVAASTVTAGNGASQSNHLTYLRVRDNTSGADWTIPLSGTSASLTWTDPRGGMAAGTHTYIITAYYTGLAAYDNFYPGHWEDEHDNPDDGDEVTGSHWEPDHHDYGINESDFTQFDQQTTAVTAVVAGPTIATQPAALTKSAGLPATFTVTPAGTAPFSYQWRKDGTNIAGATGQTLALANVQAADMAAYSVVVSNSAGSVTSAGASLTVTAAAPSVVGMPASSVVNNGTSTNLTVNAAGTGPLSYQWRKNGVDVAGATGATLALTGIGLANTGSYTVVITNSLGTVTSSAVTLGTYLTATPTPSATIVVGAVPTFNVTVAAVGTVAVSTVTAANSASQTNHLTWVKVRDNGTGQEWNTAVSGTSASFTWTDPRGGMAAGTRTYVITAYYTGFTPYDNFYPGHQEDEHDNPDDWDEVTGSHWEPDHHDYGISENDFTQFDQQTTIITATNGTAQTIAFGALPNKTTADAPFTVSATASSGLPVSFAVTSGPATISGNTVTLTGAGAVTITASQPGGSGFAPATIVQQSFSVVFVSAPAITSANNTAFVSGQAGSFTVTATGAPVPTFSIASGTSLPSWAALNATTGVISGTPTSTTGSPFSFTIAATNSVNTATQAFTLTVNASPTITTQPANVAVNQAQTATFTVIATGSPAPTYQWRKNGTAISGATAATLSLTNVQPADAASYTVVATNSAGSVTSNAATLTCNIAPQITSAASTTFSINQANTFTVVATGMPAPTFNISAGTLPGWASLNATSGAITGTPTSTAGSPFTFTVAATNSAGASSQSFTLTASVIAAPAITTQPASAIVTHGQSITFSVAASGSPAPTYQWQRQPSGTTGFSNVSDTGSYSGSTTTTLTVAATVAMNGDQFRCVATNASGTATSTAATLTVNKVSQTITFPTLADHVYGDAPFTISAIASSSLAVTFSVVSGPATVSGNTLTLTGGGTVTIRTSQAGDATYAAATPVDRTFTVTVGPNFHTLTVQGGTASAVGGNPGDVITITATIPSGQNFLGWTMVSGTGSVQRVAQTSTNFTMGTTDATVSAGSTTAAPVYNIDWREINFPTVATVNGQTDTMIVFSAVAVNNGTIPWDTTAVAFQVRLMGNTGSPNAYAYLGQSEPAGVAVGGTAVLFFILGVESAPANWGYYVKASNSLFNASGQWDSPGNNATPLNVIQAVAGGPSSSRSQFLLNGQPNGVIPVTGTAGVPFTFTPAVSSPATGAYAIKGTLPTGLTFNTSTGAISGTTNQVGRFGVTLTSVNGAGYSSSAVFITIVPYDLHTLTVDGGTLQPSNATSGSFAQGSMASVTAPATFQGKLFSGWQVTSGSATIANPLTLTTNVTMGGGNATVKANYVDGYSLSVVRGTSTLIAGPAGATASLTADPDSGGMMFSNWVVTGSGSVDKPTSQTATFTMGAGNATVTANFVPGYRLTIVGGGGTASAAGGPAGTVISISAPNYAGTNGFWSWKMYIDGPGYIDNSLSSTTTVIMGAGPMSVIPQYWPGDQGPPIITYMLGPTAGNPGASITMTVHTIDTHGTLTNESLDYSTDGGNNWTPAAAWPGGSVTPNTSTPGDWVLTYTFGSGFPNPGTVVLRAKGGQQNFYSAPYSYRTITLFGSTVPTATAATNIGDMRFNANWAAVTGATYRLDVSTSSTFATFIPNYSNKDVGNNLNDLVFTPSNGQGTVYYYRVRAVTSAGTSNSSNVINLTTTGIQVPTATAATVVGNLQFTANWTTANGATGYRLDVSTDSNFTTFIPGYQDYDVGNFTNTLVFVPSGGQGTTYHYRVRSVAPNGTTGSSNVIDVTTTGTAPTTVPPNITTQPVGLTASPGQAVTFTVTATGTPSPTFQWKKDGVVLTTGATSASYAIGAAQSGDAGSYTVVVTNSAGTVTSNPAVLAVSASTSINLQIYRP